MHFYVCNLCVIFHHVEFITNFEFIAKITK